jgi:RHS repeat-associated protein
MNKVIQFLTVLICYFQLSFADEKKSLNELFSFSDINHSVNVISGEWVETGTDYETIGPHALVVKRIFYDIGRHTDEIAPEWQFSLPHLTSSGFPLFEMEGYEFVYDQHKQLVSAKNRFGRSVKVERQGSSKINLSFPGNRKVHYQFEKINNVNRLKTIKRPGLPDRNYTYVKGPLPGQVLIKKRTDGDGHYLEWKHDSKGKVISLIAPAANTKDPVEVAHYHYEFGKTEIIEPTGYKKVYFYNTQQEITKIEHYAPTLQKSEIFEWKNGRLIAHKIYDPNSQIIAAHLSEYDEKDRLIKETWQGDLKGLNTFDSFSRYLKYDDKNRLIEEKDDEGGKVTYKWDDKLLLFRQEGFTKTEYKYNSDNLLIEQKVSEGDVFLITRINKYSVEGLPEEIEELRNNQLLSKKSIKYSTEGWVISETIQTEDVFTSTVYERDEAGRVLSSTNEKGDVELFTYDKQGNLTEHKTPFKTMKMEYDFMNRIISEEGGSHYVYDVMGNTTAKYDRFGNKTDFKYDAMNRLIEVSEPLIITPLGPVNPLTRYKYDLFNRASEKIEPSGDTTTTRFNLRGDPVEIIYPDNSRDIFEYTLKGKLKRSLTRDLKEQTYDYNEKGQLIHKKESYFGKILSEKIYTYSLDKLIKEESLEHTLEAEYLENGKLASLSIYDEKSHFEIKPGISLKLEDSPFVNPIQESSIVNSLGQLVLSTTFIDEQGIKTVKEFDALNRVVKIERFDVLGQKFEEQQTLYDLYGEPSIETWQGIQTVYERGVGGRVEKLIEAYGTPEQRITRYNYNERGEIERLIKPDGVHIHFSYEAGQLTQILSSDKSIAYRYYYQGDRLVRADDLNQLKSLFRSYNGLNLITEETFLNGLTVKYDYDINGRKKALILPDNSSIEYEYDGSRLSNISRSNSDDSKIYQHLFLPNNEKFILELGNLDIEKDNQGRIASICSPYRSESYKYNPLLSTVTVDGITTDFEYDSKGQLIKNGVDSLAYDERGNPSSINGQSFTYNKLNEVQNCDYKYDLNGNLIKTPDLTLKYDALNRLVEAQSSDEVVHYSYDPFNRRMCRNNVLYFWDGREEIGSFRNKILDLKIMGPDRIIACEIEGIPYAVQTDFRGTPVLYIGEYEIKREGPFALQAKRQDATTGFIYFGAREYDPILKRFISCDPKGYQDGFNKYHYAHNNPNLYTDPFGHTSILDSWKNTLSYGMHALKTFYHSLQSFRDWINQVSGLSAVYKFLDQVAGVLLGKGFVAYSGAYVQPNQSGVFGNGEISSKVRITFIHGIMNIRSDLVDNLRQLSAAHGGVNIHYIFRPTRGFCWDLLKCGAIKFGWVSPEAKQLIRTWKALIEEMGGVEGDGKIIHYAHSLGGTDTFTALTFLTPEEQKMIDIRTIGSATLIPEEGYYTVMNYLSVRDGVGWCDPIRRFQSIFGRVSNVVLLGSLWGIPMVDHPLSVDTYQMIIRTLGQAFLQTYAT